MHAKPLYSVKQANERKTKQKLNKYESALQLKNHCVSLYVPLHYLYYHYVCLLRCRHYPEGSLFIYFCLKKNSMIRERD